MSKYKIVARRLFSDWQMPDFLPEVYLDVEHFIGKMEEIGAKSIDFCCKSAFGNCLYPSKVGFPNKAIKGDGDIFGKLCRLANSRGIEVFAYYNMLLDDKMGNAHTEWLQVNKDGAPLFFESYAMFCMNSPYRDYAFAHMSEIASLFPIDGFNLDLQYFHGQGCFCDFCREKFFRIFGYELDVSAFYDMSNWIDLHAFQRDSRRDFIWEAMDRCHEMKPDLKWYWNHSGFFNDDAELDSRATLLATEVHPPDYKNAVTKAKWIQSSGKPIMFYMPESIGSWGHWSITTPGTLKGMCALALAHGGAVSCNHVAPPTGDCKGRVSLAVYDLLTDVMAWIGEREHLCLEKESVPVVGVLHSAKNTALEDAFRLANTNGAQIKADKAVGIENSIIATAALVESRVAVDLFYNEQTMDRLNEYEAVVLPNVGYMDTELADRIRDYVAEGGKLIATYNSSLLDENAQDRENFLLADVFGADFCKYSSYSLAYLDGFADVVAHGIPNMPLLMKDAGYQTNSVHRPIYCSLREGAQGLAAFTEPIIESDWSNGQHIYHDHAPPGTKTDWQAVILNNFGKGQCVFLPFAFLQSYQTQPNPWYQNLLVNILRTLGVPQKIDVSASPSVQFNLTQDEDGWILHLIKIMKETNSMFLDELSPTGPVEVIINPGWRVNSVTNALSSEPIPHSTQNHTTTFAIPNVKDYTIVRIAKEKR